MARKQRESGQNPNGNRYKWGAGAANKYGAARANQHNLAVCGETYAALGELRASEGRSFKELIRRAIGLYQGTTGLPTPPGTVIHETGQGDYRKRVRA